ncbi:transporter substrate-binding domain-containing protein [Crocosphaera sp. XPORK-15E]|uniref:substrate-binding periplasmic protein n=1 Tax=Crocosphaera sp. XPORK-15E TaxID=3110247 RepID=UPI002B2130C5|nr:transporter substrate-binding domain-containing protein [Crocosphaera sp. XPORK-15E]MEA5535099.1 transporter substrate-binding domain-containing protein [Crocosphaera sp. XPORK-15E]
MSFKSVKQWEKLFLLVQASAIMQLTIPQLTIAQNNPVDSQKTINFGFAEDAYPVSSLADQSSRDLDRDTFCYQLYEYLKTEKKFSSYKFKLIPISYTQDFGDKIITYEEEEIELQVNCGSISITDEREKILESKKDGPTFSNKYFETPSKYIVKKDKLNLKSALENRSEIDPKNKITVIYGTTQYFFLKQYYSKNLDQDLPQTQSRSEVREKLLEDNNIVAYLTDDILLKGMLIKFPEIIEKYQYVTKYPTRDPEKLGILIYNKELLGDTINQWINETGKDWIREKNEDLDNQLRDLNRQHWIKDNFLLIIIIIVVIILVVILCFIVLQRKKSKQQKLTAIMHLETMVKELISDYEDNENKKQLLTAIENLKQGFQNSTQEQIQQRLIGISKMIKRITDFAKDAPGNMEEVNKTLGEIKKTKDILESLFNKHKD